MQKCTPTVKLEEETSTKSAINRDDIALPIFKYDKGSELAL